MCNSSIIKQMSFYGSLSFNSHSLVLLQKPQNSSCLGMTRRGKGLSGGGRISLRARRLLGRGHRAAGGRCAQGAEGKNRGIIGVPGRGTTACQILRTQKERNRETAGHGSVRSRRMG